MKDAAHRHHDAANKLHDENKRAAAAYLYGLAAECAVKALLEKQGVRPQADARKSDPYYAHFPELRASSKTLSAAAGQRSLTRS
jgi:hypothetical protein